MSDPNVIRMAFDPIGFREALRQAASAADLLRLNLDAIRPTPLDCATWEPHDWSEWL